MRTALYELAILTKIFLIYYVFQMPVEEEAGNKKNSGTVLD